jgi:hypothetical protein
MTSIATAPLSMLPNWNPRMVTTGISAFFLPSYMSSLDTWFRRCELVRLLHRQER